MEEFEERDLEKTVAWTNSELFQNHLTKPVREYVSSRIKVSRDDWLRSDYHNLLLRPIKRDKALMMSLPGRDRRLATLSFPRATSDPRFSNRDIRLLEAVAPFIARALMAHHPQGPYVDSDQRAFVITDARGAMQHATFDAQSLLLMAQGAAGRTPQARQIRPRLPDAVQRLCQLAAAWSESRPLPASPAWRCKNDRGEFVFRVFRLEQHDGQAAPRLIGGAIERREPLRLKLLRRLGELPLSARETELCLALLDGDSRGAIAERMGVSETTAITHTRNLYNKLDVHNRMELVEKLQAM